MQKRPLFVFALASLGLLDTAGENQVPGTPAIDRNPVIQARSSVASVVLDSDKTLAELRRNQVVGKFSASFGEEIADLLEKMAKDRKWTLIPAKRNEFSTYIAEVREGVKQIKSGISPTRASGIKPCALDVIERMVRYYEISSDQLSEYIFKDLEKEPLNKVLEFYGN